MFRTQDSPARSRLGFPKLAFDTTARILRRRSWISSNRSIRSKTGIGYFNLDHALNNDTALEIMLLRHYVDSSRFIASSEQQNKSKRGGLRRSTRIYRAAFYFTIALLDCQRVSTF